MLGTSQFAGDLPCQYCSKKNAATRWPRNGDKVPFYYQKAPGKYYVAVTCPHCCKVWYVAWDDNPGHGCEVGPKAAAGVRGGPCGQTGQMPVLRPHRDGSWFDVADCGNQRPLDAEGGNHPDPSGV